MTSDFRVGSWLVKPSLNLICRGVTNTHLEPKVMELLVCLADHAGETVAKETLVQRIWPETFVSDDALKRCISDLRRALEDDAREPQVIQTIPKRGYRFIAPVDRSATDGRGVSIASITRDSIAVLPFVNMSPDPENEFLADGITEEIINALSQIEQLRVAARTSSFFFKGKHVDMRQIGEQLNARTILEGSVRKVQDRLRITAQLVNVADGYQALSKNTKLFERCSLEFRAEFFNIFNHTQFSTVDENFNSRTFGQPIHAEDPRIGQLALKLSF